MTENKQYITNNPHNKSYIFCDSVRLNNIEVAKTLNELATKCSKLEKENEQLKQQIKHSQKRTALISGWLHDEGNLTLDKYEEILDYCYQQYKKEVLND